jgi:hypothetical protein
LPTRFYERWYQAVGCNVRGEEVRRRRRELRVSDKPTLNSELSTLNSEL